ncbi:MAG: septation regulator SpoVG [Firmicutes bacterium]|nr:septation regulator SpoVG [Bacillota bacterium]
MNISDIRIRLKKNEDESKRVRAVASVTIDECFVVHDIKVLEGDSGLHIAFPSRKTRDGEYRDIAHPLNTETRDFLSRLILAEYEKAYAADAAM